MSASHEHPKLSPVTTNPTSAPLARVVTRSPTGSVPTVVAVDRNNGPPRTTSNPPTANGAHAGIAGSHRSYHRPESPATKPPTTVATTTVGTPVAPVDSTPPCAAQYCRCAHDTQRRVSDTNSYPHNIQDKTSNNKCCVRCTPSASAHGICATDFETPAHTS